jgi:hypothetical protein
MPKRTVDGIAVEVPGGATVLQACELAGIKIALSKATLRSVVAEGIYWLSNATVAAT